jgi:hypothetical protein
MDDLDDVTIDGTTSETIPAKLPLLMTSFHKLAIKAIATTWCFNVSPVNIFGIQETNCNGPKYIDTASDWQPVGINSKLRPFQRLQSQIVLRSDHAATGLSYA